MRGQDATLAVTDPSVQAGLGVFETIAVRDGRPLESDDHLVRLSMGASRLGVPLPFRPGLATAVEDMARGVRGGCGWLKVIATRSGHCAVFGGAMDPAEEGRSISAVLLRGSRDPLDPLVGVKTLSYAASHLGIEEARRHGVDEGLWLNTRGHLAEACASNLFVVWKGKVFTPAVREGILPGIVRALAIRAVRKLGLPLYEGRVRLHRLETAGEAFVTSSLCGVRPLVAFQGKRVGKGCAGRITMAISAEVARLRAWPEVSSDQDSGGELPGSGVRAGSGAAAGEAHE